MHTTSRRIIDLLIAESIGTLIIGKNPFWKQDPTIRKKDKQHFVQLPHARFMSICSATKLSWLAFRSFCKTEENYPLKASFLDLDPIPTYGEGRVQALVFSGSRVKRGMYKTSDKYAKNKR